MTREEIMALIAAYEEEDAATRDCFEAADHLLGALNRLKEQNKTVSQRTRVAFNFKGGMAGGGSDATRAHDQVRDILENQIRSVMAVRANTERVIPLLEMNVSLARRVLDAMKS